MKTDDIKIKPRWSKNRDEIWDEKFAGLEDDAPAPVIRMHRRNIFTYVAVAVVVVVLAIPSTAFLYTKTIVAPMGGRLSLVLPDGSTAELNADSRLKYKPLWWRFSRNIHLNGEAYFEVAKGKKFTVNSDNGTVNVLGTSFNVFTREGIYRVTCLTGKVQVENRETSVLLEPNMQARLDKGRLATEKTDDAEESLAWTQNRFSFSSVPLKYVIGEIERQYNIKVALPANTDYIYNGKFTKPDTPERALEIVGKALGIRLEIKR